MRISIRDIIFLTDKPRSRVPKEEKEEYVESVIELLELQECVYPNSFEGTNNKSRWQVIGGAGHDIER